MIDTGAEISLIPPKPSESSHPNPHLVLQAVNRSNIKTFGQRLLELDLGLRRTFRWIFVVADMPDPILGADFLHAFNLSPHLRASRLIDHTTRLSAPCKQKSSILWSISTITNSLPTQFANILRRFPNLTKPLSTVNPPKHQVFHHIHTNGPPCHSRPRRLPVEKRKIAFAEFEHMIGTECLSFSSSPSYQNPLETGVRVEIFEL